MDYNTSSVTAETILAATNNNFEEIALQIFNYQYIQNSIYNNYCNALRIDPQKVKKLNQIPFLPISFFKSHKVVSGTTDKTDYIFESSGTTAEIASKHYVRDGKIYEQSLLNGFKQFYGEPKDYTILALLPSYLERKNASLVHMAKTLIDYGGNVKSGFYINEWNNLQSVLLELEQKNQKTILLGVTFALLDFAEMHPLNLKNTIIMETGGMKGRKEEMTRQEVHTNLKKQFNLPVIHSEYGMTELLSQSYSSGNGIFKCTNTMKIMVRDINDPFEIDDVGTGAINVIDLANINSCSFIATDDIGKLKDDNSFEVLGRLDNSALRGCSLMTI